MKTKKELIQITIDNFEKYFVKGLCDYFWKLKFEGLITKQELVALHVLLDKHTKISNYFITNYFKPYLRTSGIFYWKKGAKAPRKRFLKYLKEIL